MEEDRDILDLLFYGFVRKVGISMSIFACLFYNRNRVYFDLRNILSKGGIIKWHYYDLRSLLNKRGT